MDEWSEIFKVPNRAEEYNNGVNSRLDEAKESMNKSEGSLRNWWDNSKWNNICIIGVPEEEEREKVAENLFEKIMTENYPELREQKSRSRKPRKLQIRWTKKDTVN